MSTISGVADAAKDFGYLGWRVVLLHGIVDGVCTCRDAEKCDYRNRGKHPRLTGWQHNATSDPTAIERLFDKYPTSNVGVRLGPQSNLVDVEYDDADGEATAERLLSEIQTPTYTSDRSTHRLFAFPRGLALPTAVVKAAGLELRFGTDQRGAQSVLPPSLHASGKRYAWLPGLSPDDVELADFPDCLRELLETEKPTSNDADELTLVCASTDLATAPGVGKGERNKQLCILVGTHIATHGNDAQLMPLALAFGARCDPPLPEQEIFKAVAAIVQRHLSKANGQQPTATVAIPTPPKPKQFEYRPFPTAALPDVLADFVRQAAKAISCDESYIALPMLTTIAASIGNSIRFQVRPDWQEPSIVWTGIVGPPGDRKTPAIAVAAEPLLDIEKALQAAYAGGQQERERQQLSYEAELARWKAEAKKGNTAQPPPLQVEAEAEPRLWADDTTVEALGMILDDNPRGLLLRKDELTAWLRSFSEYKKAGGDLQRWLSIHNAAAVAIDRKSGDAIKLWLPNVSVTGGIQPALLQSFFSGEHVGAGLMQRFLFCYPPTRPAKLSKAGIGANIKADYAAVLRRLQQIPYEDTPAVLSLSADAWEAFAAWHDYLEQDFKPSDDGILREVGSKLCAGAVRLAGIMQCVTDAHAMEITSSSMRLGITLARWSLDEWCRVHDQQHEPADQRRDRQLIGFINNKFGGRCTAAELSRYRRDMATSADAEAALLKLSAAGWGAMTTTPTDGRPRCEFVSNSAVASTEAP